MKRKRKMINKTSVIIIIVFIYISLSVYFTGLSIFAKFLENVKKKEENIGISTKEMIIEYTQSVVSKEERNILLWHHGNSSEHALKFYINNYRKGVAKR